MNTALDNKEKMAVKSERVAKASQTMSWDAIIHLVNKTNGLLASAWVSSLKYDTHLTQLRVSVSNSLTGSFLYFWHQCVVRSSYFSAKM